MRNKLCGAPTNRLGKDELYDPLIDLFIESKNICLEVEVLGINTSHLAANLNKSINEKGLEESIETVIRNNIVYLVIKQHEDKEKNHIPNINN